VWRKTRKVKERRRRKLMKKKFVYVDVEKERNWGMDDKEERVVHEGIKKRKINARVTKLGKKKYKTLNWIREGIFLLILNFNLSTKRIYSLKGTWRFDQKDQPYDQWLLWTYWNEIICSVSSDIFLLKNMS
jgi:hypothetical protein